jgi:hypothetical protein
MRKIDINKGNKEIFDRRRMRHLIWIREFHKGYNKCFDHEKIIVDPRCVFGIENFLRELI